MDETPVLTQAEMIGIFGRITDVRSRKSGTRLTLTAAMSQHQRRITGQVIIDTKGCSQPPKIGAIAVAAGFPIQRLDKGELVLTRIAVEQTKIHAMEELDENERALFSDPVSSPA